MRSSCAARRSVVSPAQPGRNSKEGSWVQWLTRIRKVNGTIACQESGGQASGVRAEVSRDPRDMAKAGLLESQSPADARIRPSEWHPKPAPRSATASVAGRRNLRGVERCPARAIKEMSGTPTSRSDVRQGRTRDQPAGREPRGDGVLVVVVGVTTHQGGRESRPQGEGAQVAGHRRPGGMRNAERRNGPGCPP